MWLNNHDCSLESNNLPVLKERTTTTDRVRYHIYAVYIAKTSRSIPPSCQTSELAILNRLENEAALHTQACTLTRSPLTAQFIEISSVDPLLYSAQTASTDRTHQADSCQLGSLFNPDLVFCDKPPHLFDLPPTPHRTLRCSTKLKKHKMC